MNKFSETLLMNAPNVMLVADHNNKIIFVNSAFGKLIGERSHDYIGKSLDETLSHIPGKWEFLVEEFSRPLMNSEKEVHLESRENQSNLPYERDPLISRSSETLNIDPPSVISLKEDFFTYQIFDAGLTSGGDQLKGLVLNDITKEKEFLDRMTQAENISSLKTLAAGISHEISNPLHSILSFSEALLHEEAMEKVRLYASKIVENSTRLGKVLVEFSGYIQGKKNGNKVDVNIIDTIKASLKFATLSIPDNKTLLEENYECTPILKADPEEVQQIFFNIIHNSLQAMNGMGRLKITVREEQKSFVIQFSDNGPGMPIDILRKAFNPFFTTKMQGEGTGLGLNITQRLVEKYKGKIDIQSKEGEGTEVSLFFPVSVNSNE